MFHHRKAIKSVSGIETTRHDNSEAEVNIQNLITENHKVDTDKDKIRNVQTE